MNGSAARWTAGALAAAVVALTASLLVLGLGIAGSTAKSLAGAGLVLMLVSVAAVGLVVAWHQPRNAIGWLLLGCSVCFLLTFNAGSYDTLIYHLHHRRLPFGQELLLLQPLGEVGTGVFPLVILLFPDGHLPSRRWAWLLWPCVVLVLADVAAAVGVTLGSIASHHVRVLADGNLATSEHPAGGTAWLVAPQTAALAAIAVLAVGAIGHQAASWRRASGERRQQLKWLMSGATIAMVIGGSSVFFNSVVWEVTSLGFAALPVSIGVGILKYRLYDIDRIISRTLAYAIVTGSLVGAYAGLVTLTSHAFSLTKPWEVAAATLAAAALFNPLRRRVQVVVDRQFNRARYDAGRTVAAFSGRLRDAIDLESVQDDLLTTVQESLAPAHAGLWLAGSRRPAPDPGRVR